jgi:ribonuclease-3
MEHWARLLKMIKLPDFKNKDLFEQAFTHRSYLNETKQKTESNERLEFLGDSILSFIVSEYLYRSYPDYKEGALTNLRSLLVNTKSLAGISKELGFGKLLKLSKGEEESQGRENESLLANSFEAFIGALYMDQGIKAVKEFLIDTLLIKAESYAKQQSLKDPKSLLQESVQAQKQKSPVYEVILEEGPPHAKMFTVGVYVQSTLLGTGQGKSKQEAEENAAKQALERNPK